MKFLVLIFAIASLLLATINGSKETRLEIDDMVENIFMRNNRIPGLGLSVVQNETVFMSRGYGLRNMSKGLPSDGNTLFSIGSLTKSFTAVVVVKTLNEIYPELGVGVLDVPLAQLIPPTVNFTLSDRYRAEYTTFRDILSHRTCLASGQVEVVFGTIPTESEYAYRSRYLLQVCEFRNGFVNNHNMFSLAGETIAGIAGTTLSNLLISFVRDLGMANTTYINVNGTYETLPDMAWPYVIKNGNISDFDIDQVRKVHMALGSGGILSTANDMTKYMNFRLNLGRLGERQIVPENVMRWLHTVSNPIDFQGSRMEEVDSIVAGDLGSAQGFFRGLYDGWDVIHHDGKWPPYHSSMMLFPTTKIGIFICTNGPGIIYNFPTHNIVAQSIFELVRGSPGSLEEILYKQRNIGTPFVEHQLINGHKTNRHSTVLHKNQMRSRVDAEEVLGLYGHPHDGDITITYEPESGNTSLQINFSEWAIGRLYPIPGYPTTFRIAWITGIMDHFYTYPSPLPDFYVNFGIADTVLFRMGEFYVYQEYEFIKNATLDTFPAIPWSPTSCGPAQKTDS